MEGKLVKPGVENWGLEEPAPAICGVTADRWLLKVQDVETGEVVEVEWSNVDLSCAVCECPMNPRMPSLGVLVSINPAHDA